MALQFQKQRIICLQNVLSQVQNLEQTQELRLTGGMPGVGHIPGCWGQILIRSKEWQGDIVRLSGGVLVWVLYVPEDGGESRTLESWIPFQTDWEVPEQSREGWIQVKALLRFVDARPVSAGKVLIRAGIGLQIQCWSPDDAEVFRLEGSETDVEVRKECWPVMLAKEAGEKVFALEEELSLPGSMPKPERLVYYRMTEDILDKKVLGNKLVFRGSGHLHMLYQSAQGQLCSWDFELPFSQYAQLSDSFSSDARADVQLEVTALELGLDGEGRLQLRSELTGQYLIADRELLETVADAYCPLRQLKLQRTQVKLPVLLDARRETVRGEKPVPIQADVVADAVFLPDHPRQRQDGDVLSLDQTGMIQLLYYSPEGQLQGTSQRWEGNLSLKADEQVRVMALPLEPQIQVQEQPDAIMVKAEIPLQLYCASGTGIAMVTEAEIGERITLPENRPALILRRADGQELWDIARMSGSRVSLIQEANGLEGEPEAGRMLLIPVV